MGAARLTNPRGGVIGGLTTVYSLSNVHFTVYDNQNAIRGGTCYTLAQKKHRFSIAMVTVYNV